MNMCRNIRRGYIPMPAVYFLNPVFGSSSLHTGSLHNEQQAFPFFSPNPKHSLLNCRSVSTASILFTTGTLSNQSSTQSKCCFPTKHDHGSACFSPLTLNLIVILSLQPAFCLEMSLEVHFHIKLK